MCIKADEGNTLIVSLQIWCVGVQSQNKGKHVTVLILTESICICVSECLLNLREVGSVCETMGGRKMNELEKAPRLSKQSPSTGCNKECMSLWDHHITVKGGEDVLFFPLQNKKLNPCWVPLRGAHSPSHLPLPLRPLGDAEPAHPPFLPFLFLTPPPSPSLSPLISLLLRFRVNSRSDRVLIFPLGSGSHLHSLAVFRPPTADPNLLSIFKPLLGKHYLFLSLLSSSLLRSKVIWHSPGPVKRPRGLVTLWGKISE